MPRLLVHVEGETEEHFVNEVLRDHLVSHGFDGVSARLMGNARQRNRRGGIRAWNTAKRDIVRHMNEDRDCIATTMVDYYGLPQLSGRAWPGRAEAAGLPVAEKPMVIETALSDDIAAEMGADFNRRRFVPFVVMHEFEGLLFSDCDAFGRGAGRPDLIPRLQEIRNQFASPEEIDDSPVTAPSKRVEALIPGYQKPFLGTLAALEIGMARIRSECPHFADWLARLESLTAN